MRAVIYARQSKDVAEGIDRQLERTRRLAETRGYTVVRVYTDNDVSATKRRGATTGWAAMLKALGDGEADVVIAVDLDRLTRSLRDLLDLMETGAAVLTVDGEMDLTTADGEFRASLMASLARFEVRRKSERQNRANEFRAAQRRPNPQRRRYGYSAGLRSLVEPEATVVRRIYAEVAAGRSLRSLAKALNEEGATTATGKPWTPARLRDLVGRPYEGGFTFRGEVIESQEVPAIVEREVAATARAVLADPTRRTTPGNAVRHLASGLVYCGECGGPLVYMATYRCKADASHPSITKKLLDPLIGHEVARAIATYTGEVRVAGVGADVRELVERHKALEARASAVIADRDEGLVSAQVARGKLIELRDEREAVETALEEARASSSALMQLHELASSIRAGQVGVVEAAFWELGLDDQRELVRQLIRVTVHRGRGVERVEVDHLEAGWLNDWNVQADANL